MLKNYKNMIQIWQFRAIHGAMIQPNTKFFHDGLLTPAVRIFCSPRLRSLISAVSYTVSAHRWVGILYNLNLSNLHLRNTLEFYLCRLAFNFRRDATHRHLFLISTLLNGIPPQPIVHGIGPETKADYQVHQTHHKRHLRGGQSSHPIQHHTL